MERYLYIAAACAAIISCAMLFLGPVRDAVSRWYRRGYPQWIWMYAISAYHEQPHERLEREAAWTRYEKRVRRHRIRKAVQALLVIAVVGAIIVLVVFLL